ncbi:MAG: hypothetical protein QXF07_02745 [Candidatus Micrarchaeia archaeon]
MKFQRARKTKGSTILLTMEMLYLKLWQAFCFIAAILCGNTIVHVSTKVDVSLYMLAAIFTVTISHNFKAHFDYFDIQFKTLLD